MGILRELLEADDLSKLSNDQVSQLEKLVRDGANDTEQQWANALELVHKAYEVAQIQRPTPDMESAWKQYEEILCLAVKQLAKKRGLDGKWRMSAHIFHEAAPATPDMPRFEITSEIDGLPVVSRTKAHTIDDVISPIYRYNITGHDLEVKHRSKNHCCVHFVKDGKRTGNKITIKRLPDDQWPDAAQAVRESTPTESAKRLQYFVN
jgi:hypothetical protein